MSRSYFLQEFVILVKKIRNQEHLIYFISVKSPNYGVVNEHTFELRQSFGSEFHSIKRIDLVDSDSRMCSGPYLDSSMQEAHR